MTSRGHVIEQGDGILRRLLAAVFAALTILPPTAQAAPEWQYQWRKWLPPVWQRIAHCETGTTWTWNSGTYWGAFGMYRGTWLQYRLPGYPAEAFKATPWQQYRVARVVAAHHTLNAWGCYRNREWVRNG